MYGVFTYIWYMYVCIGNFYTVLTHANINKAKTWKDIEKFCT